MPETPIKDDTQPQPVITSQGPYYTYPGPAFSPPPKRSGCGCWIAGLSTGFVVTVLVIIGLFLPPISLGDRLFGTRYAMLSPQNNAVAIDGITLIVDPAEPGQNFGISLDTIGLNEFLSRSDVDWVPAARAALPPYLALQSSIFTIKSTGDAPDTVTLLFDVPPTAGNPDVLDLYRWDDVSGQWFFLPSHMTSDGKLRTSVHEVPGYTAIFQASPLAPLVLTRLESGQRISSDIAGLSTIISPSGMQPALPTNQNRTLVGNPAGGFDVAASYLVMPYVHNFADPRATDPNTVISLISNRELRDEHIHELTAFASAGQYDGLMIDYRDLSVDQRANFSVFIRDLAERMHSAHLVLGVAVPAAENINGTWETGAYDWRLIGQYADYVQVNLSFDPTAYAPGPDRLVEAMLRWAVGEVSRYKLIGGMSALSIQQVMATGDFTPIAYDQALVPLGDVNLEVLATPGGTVLPGSEIRIGLDGFDALPGVDTTIQAPFVDYYAADGTEVTSRMWLTTGDALRYRMDRLSLFAMGGVAFADLLADGVVSDVPEAILKYKIQLPNQPSAAELVLNWRIESAAGKITEFTTGFRDEIVVTLDAPDGNYAVNVDVAGGSISSSRGGAAVALFAATATATPLPTSTPSPSPTVTPTLAPIVPTVPPAENPGGSGNVAPPSGNAGAAIRPGAGSIALGSFEYGGHVTSAGSERAINAMRNAGMSWMKVQIQWRPGGGTGQASEAISQAHGAGFKILLGIVGNQADLAAGGGDYIRQFGAFIGDVAALGPDAIEVWNEPNIAREWPQGQISGANYTALLREAYSSAKARNGSVMIISAALAPTGAEAAYPGQVVNDDNFLRQMVESGAMSFMDCLGMHYNEGIISPRSTSGDPRDNFYSRYLPTMIDLYWNISGGQRPICITELGYLSPEGFPPLSAFWSWAQNVTVAQQAAWLADAAAYVSNTGRVKLMIVWNVDFQNYGPDDPMAGFAMIRPDGSCPACGAMAGAR